MNRPAFRLDTRMFTSTVARRAFALFIACAVLPVTALAILAFQQVTSQLQEQAQRRLQQASKGVALVIMHRLLAADAELLQAPMGPRTPGSPLPRPLAETVITTNAAPETPLPGEPTAPALTAAQIARVATGKSVLSAGLDEAGRTRVVISRALDPARPERGVIHGRVDPDFLWALDDDVSIPPQAKLVVLDETGRVLFSSFDSGQPIPDVVTRPTPQSIARHFAWRAGDQRYLATRWGLFLQASMGVSRWTIVLSEPEDDVLAPDLPPRHRPDPPDRISPERAPDPAQPDAPGPSQGGRAPPGPR